MEKVLWRSDPRGPAPCKQGYDLGRFRKPQRKCMGEAIREIRSLRKTGHWIWYAFPQMKGLGKSPLSEYYGIVSVGEAKAFDADRRLGKRLRKLFSELALLPDGVRAEDVFGELDARKVRSCATLFWLATGRDVYRSALDKLFYGVCDPITVKLAYGTVRSAAGSGPGIDADGALD